MDILHRLKEDHQKVEKMFQKIEQLSERAEKTRQKLFTDLKTEILAHAKTEQKVFYDRMKDQDKKMIKEAESEHQEVEQLLKELSGKRKSAEEFTLQLQELKENVQHHVEEEESEIFDRAREIFSEEELETLGSEFMAAKNKQKTTRPGSKPGSRSKAHAR